MTETVQHSGIFRAHSTISIDVQPTTDLPVRLLRQEVRIRDSVYRWQLDDGRTVELVWESFHLPQFDLRENVERFILTVNGVLLQVNRLTRIFTNDGNGRNRLLTLHTAKGNLAVHLIPATRTALMIDSATWYEPHELKPIRPS